MIDRRGFIRNAGGGLTALVSSPSLLSAPMPSRFFEHGDPLDEFQYAHVSFQPGLQQRQLEQTHSVLMNLNDDGLLRPFRERAGLLAPGEDLKGWYSLHGYLIDGVHPFCPASTFGQWLSALARYTAITGDAATQAKVQRLVQGFGETIEPAGKLYDQHAYPGYLYEKLTCGLVDAHQFAGNPQALNVLSRATDAALPHLPGKAREKRNTGPECGITEHCRDETFTIPENQFCAWQRGAGARHLEIAKQYMFDEFFDPLSRGENVLGGGTHAYSHVNALCSAAKAYLVLGNEKYLRAAKTGFAFLQAQSFVTGGWGPNESLLPSPQFSNPDYPDYHMPAFADPGDSLAHTYAHFETGCGSYAHFKLTRYLLRITRDSRYGDSMERIMYNAALGMLPLKEDGRAFYYSDYRPLGQKVYYRDTVGKKHDDSFNWPCCSGTLPQLAADYRISTYFHDKQGLYVNLYIPSTVSWEHNGVKVALTQAGRYPLADTIELTVNPSRPVALALRLRIPAWAQGASIRVNGKDIAEKVRSGAFASVRREWRPGDRIELRLANRLALYAAGGSNPDRVALMAGPLVLFAVSEEEPQVTREQLLAARQTQLGSEEWTTESGRGRLRLLPWWAIANETYTIYMKVSA